MTASSIVDLFRAALRDLGRYLSTLIAFEAFFKLLVAIVLLPALAALLYHLVRLAGRTAITNTDLVGFLFSPLGVCFGFLFALKALGITLLEHAGIMGLAGLRQAGHWHGYRRALLALASRGLRVLRLAGLLIGLFALALAPFALAAAGVYAMLLGGQDINYYLAERPPRFYVAATLGFGLLAGALAVAGYLCARWAFALPAVLFEGHLPGPALRISADRTRGIRGRLILILVGWQIVGVVVPIALLAGFRWAAPGLLSLFGDRPRVLLFQVSVLLIVRGLLLAIVSGLWTAINALVLLRLYVSRGVELKLLNKSHWADPLDEAPVGAQTVPRLGWYLGAVLTVLGAVYLALTLPFALANRVEVTAHRGYSRVAPENTLAAIAKAIEAGADWAEIDVQLTSDREVVVLHDNDLRRMTGDPRPIARVSLAQLRELHVSPRFGRQFASEGIPTLREVVKLARGKIKLNIELKFPGKNHMPLARRVAELLREEAFEEHCFVASLDYEGVCEARRFNPRLRTAAIITFAVGDISKLDVDVLSVKASLLNDALIREAHRLDKQVHVWTINDKREMRRLIEKGVDNIITDDPVLFTQLQHERDELGDGERLLLACRELLE